MEPSFSPLNENSCGRGNEERGNKPISAELSLTATFPFSLLNYTDALFVNVFICEFLFNFLLIIKKFTKG